MLNKKITTTMLALLCVFSMALAVAPVVGADVNAVQVASDFDTFDDWV